MLPLPSDRWDLDSGSTFLSSFLFFASSDNLSSDVPQTLTSPSRDPVTTELLFHLEEIHCSYQNTITRNQSE